MKTIISIICIILLMSCGTGEKNYSYEEMVTLIATKEATLTGDSLTVRYKYKDYKLPIIKIEEYGYYPSISNGGDIRYYIVRK